VSFAFSLCGNCKSNDFTFSLRCLEKQCVYFLTSKPPFMKKGLILSIAFLCAFTIKSVAQEGELKPFKVDVSLGYAIPGGSGAKGGVIFSVEPKYAVAENIAVGLRMEAAVMARFSGYDSNGDPVDADVKAAGSYLATGDYYFSNNYSFRPFAGIGAGIYTIANANVNNSNGTVAAGSKFGGLIRVGAEMSHFRIGIEYNLVPGSTLDGYDENGNVAKIDSKNGYLGIKIGVCLGGGPR
jgi:hypothetical protein